MAGRQGSRRTKAEQWLFGVKWRGTAKETRSTVIPEAKPPNPNTIGKDEGICLEKSRVHLHGPGQRETMNVIPGRRSDVAKTIEKDEGICLEKSRVYLHGPGRRETMDIIPGRRSDVAPGRRSMPEMEINIKEVVAVLGVRVMAADMPPFMQLHAFRCAKRSFDSLDKFSSRQLAHDVKKEFDKVYGPTWHCIVGTSYGSFVTHSRGCFLYFSMDKIIVMLFKTKIRKVLAS